ncbi:MAG: disulfide bond formation protein B [Betaproteobacteria bacterium]|nr:disulfide bond formation protein B [Betaproteobacteria bacterium]
MNDYLALARNNPPLAAAAIVTVVGALTICGFFFFQYVMLLAPCPLCLEQRYAFYFCVPLALLLWLGVNHGASSKVLFAGFLVIAVFMLWNTGLAAYHAGIEWKFWPGPSDCSGPLDKIGSVRDMMNQLQRISLVRCDEAAWRLFGISLPGYDVLVSLFLAAVAAWGARGSLARHSH